MAQSAFLQQVVGDLEKRLRTQIDIKEIHPEYGGSINDSYQLVSPAGKFFIKRNNRELYPNMLETEAESLRLLKKCTNLTVPEVLAVGEFAEWSYLVLEYFETGAMRKDFWEEFGIALANIHSQTQSNYGLDFDNYMGSIPQKNNGHQSWYDFFIQQRLTPMVKLASDSGKLTVTTVKKFDVLYSKLASLVPVDRPALLHGDLWSGNFMVHSKGGPAIFDPAIYFGHRETDIAMAHLFGGFHNRMWKAYEEEYPLLAGWEKRIDIHNLYPLLVHLNLFGTSYARQIEATLNGYC
jgi:fructosamine-3-kinase